METHLLYLQVNDIKGGGMKRVSIVLGIVFIVLLWGCADVGEKIDPPSGGNTDSSVDEPDGGDSTGDKAEIEPSRGATVQEARTGSLLAVAPLFAVIVDLSEKTDLDFSQDNFDITLDYKNEGDPGKVHIMQKDGNIITLSINSDFYLFGSIVANLSITGTSLFNIYEGSFEESVEISGTVSSVIDGETSLIFIKEFKLINSGSEIIELGEFWYTLPSGEVVQIGKESIAEVVEHLSYPPIREATEDEAKVAWYLSTMPMTDALYSIDETMLDTPIIETFYMKENPNENDSPNLIIHQFDTGFDFEVFYVDENDQSIYIRMTITGLTLKDLMAGNSATFSMTGRGATDSSSSWQEFEVYDLTLLEDGTVERGYLFYLDSTSGEKSDVTIELLQSIMGQPF